MIVNYIVKNRHYIAAKQTTKTFVSISYIVGHPIMPSSNKSEPTSSFGSEESTFKLDPHVMYRIMKRKSCMQVLLNACVNMQSGSKHSRKMATDFHYATFLD
jgi:hypothetical protein